MKPAPIDPSTPAGAALKWFVAHRSGAMTTNDARAFEVWLAADPEHQAQFKKVERSWAFIGDLQEDPVILDVQDRVNAAADARRRNVIGALAAGAALAAGGGWAAQNADMIRDVFGFTPAPAQEFHTSVGQRTTVTLLDGSVVTLDTDTALRARLTRGERRIELEHGQASFEVARDKHRPFIVAAAGKTVRATGTAFNVRVEPGRFEVVLIEGRVRVQEQGARGEGTPTADMRPGWRLAVGDDARWRMEPVDLAKENSWRHGMLTFHEDSIEYAVAEMNRYSRRKIVFDGAPPDTQVLGMFHAGDIDTFIEALEINKLARVTSRSEDEIRLAPRS